MGYRKIGFLGLGAMGLPMARNLLEKDFEVHITQHRNRKPVEELTNEGAVEHSSAAEVARSSEVLISILPADKEMSDVLLDGAVLEGLSSNGGVLIEMTSGSPGMMKQVGTACRERGIRVLDAPVSGGTIGAEKGTLTVMAGGEPSVLESVRGVLEAMAAKIYWVGGIGAGKGIKAVNQMLAGVHMAAAAEAAALAGKLGIAPDVLKQVIGSSSGSSWMLLNKLDSLLQREYTPGFKHRLMTKDIQIAVDESENTRLPVTEYVLKLYRDTEAEYGELDFSAIGKALMN